MNSQVMDFQFLLSARYQVSRWSSCIDTGTASWWRRMWGASLSASPGWTSAAGGPGGGGHAAAAGAPAGGRGGAARGCAGHGAAGARGAGGEAGGRQAGGHTDQRRAAARPARQVTNITWVYLDNIQYISGRWTRFRRPSTPSWSRWSPGRSI